MNLRLSTGGFWYRWRGLTVYLIEVWRLLVSSWNISLIPRYSLCLLFAVSFCESIAIFHTPEGSAGPRGTKPLFPLVVVRPETETKRDDPAVLNRPLVANVVRDQKLVASSIFSSLWNNFHSIFNSEIVPDCRGPLAILTYELFSLASGHDIVFEVFLSLA